MTVLVGKIVDRTTGQPLTGVDVSVQGARENRLRAHRRLRALYARGLAPGKYTLGVSSDDVPPQTFDVTVRAGKIAAIQHDGVQHDAGLFVRGGASVNALRGGRSMSPSASSDAVSGVTLAAPAIVLVLGSIVLLLLVAVGGSQIFGSANRAKDHLAKAVAMTPRAAADPRRGPGAEFATASVQLRRQPTMPRSRSSNN